MAQNPNNIGRPQSVMPGEMPQPQCPVAQTPPNAAPPLPGQRPMAASPLKEAARSNGMVTLQEDGFRKCVDGFTTVDEVMRVVFTGGH